MRHILRYLTPGFLGLILLAFAIQELPAVIEKSGTAAWVARGLALAIFLGIAVIARRALAPGANPAPAAPAPPGERS